MLVSLEVFYIFGELFTLSNCIFSVVKDIIQGKLDQRNSQLEVDYAIGRDIRPGDIGNISATIKEWCDSCEAVLNCIEQQIDSANAEKAGRLKHKEEIEKEVKLFSEFQFVLPKFLLVIDCKFEESIKNTIGRC